MSNREIGGGVICFPDLMAHINLKAPNQSWPEVVFTRLSGFVIAYCTRVNISDDTGHNDLEKYGDIIYLIKA